MHIESGLANRRLGQLVCWTLEGGLREGKTEDIVGLFKDVGCDRELGGQILAHADGLGALAGKQ